MASPNNVSGFGAGNTATNRIRVGGSSFTIFIWDNVPIAFAQQVSHTSPQPVGPGPVAIQPLDEPYPIQVITPAAAGMGSLTLNLYEVYGSKVWDRLGGHGNSGGILSGANDIVDIFISIASNPNEINMVKVIRPPILRGATSNAYAEIYHGCVVTNVVDGEQIEVGSMEILKQITVGYRYVTNPGQKGGQGFKNRDQQLPQFPVGIPNDQN